MRLSRATRESTSSETSVLHHNDIIIITDYFVHEPRLLMKWRFADRISKQMEQIKKVCVEHTVYYVYTVFVLGIFNSRKQIYYNLLCVCVYLV